MDGNNRIFQASLPNRGCCFNLSDSNGLDHIAGLVRNNGLPHYESPLPELMGRLMQASSSAMLDVGANTGLFSLLAAAASTQARVYAFEPLDNVRELLKANIGLNPSLSARIGVYPIGLSNAAGTFDFYETINDHGLITTSSSLELGHAEQIGAYRKQVIQTQTLDGWAAQANLQSVNLIKIDVEGHEYAVIEGGRATLRRHRPMITIELLDGSRHEPIEQMMFEEHYLDLVITPGALRYSEVLTFHPDGWNHLLCPAERVATILQACRELKLRLDVV